MKCFVNKMTDDADSGQGNGAEQHEEHLFKPQLRRWPCIRSSFPDNDDCEKCEETSFHYAIRNGEGNYRLNDCGDFNCVASKQVIAETLSILAGKYLGKEQHTVRRRDILIGLAKKFRGPEAYPSQGHV